MKEKYIKLIAVFIVLTLSVSIITSNIIAVTGISLMSSRRGGVVAQSGTVVDTTAPAKSGGSSNNPAAQAGGTTAASGGAAATKPSGGTATTAASGGNTATTAAQGSKNPDPANPNPTNAAPVDNSAEYAKLLADYTAVVTKVKVDRPGYKNNDWQEISNKDMKIFALVNGIAGNFLETKEESSEGHHEKGSYPKWFAMPTNETAPVGCVLTDTSKVESASVKDNADGTRTITITLIPEKDPVKDFDNPASVSSWHGQMFDVIDITQVVEYAKKIPGVNTDNAYCTFHGTATLTYNPANNQCVSLDHVIDVAIFLSGQANVVADYHFYDFEW